MPSVKDETWAQSGWRTSDSGEFTAERGKALDHGWLHCALVLDSKSWCPGLSCTEWNLIPGASSVQLLRRVRLFATPWTAACQASLSISNSQSLLKLMFIELVMPSNHLILCHRLLRLPSVFSSIRVFSNESALCMRWPKYWSFSFSISPSNEYSELISFRIDQFDLLAVQGTKSAVYFLGNNKILWLKHDRLGRGAHREKAQLFKNFFICNLNFLEGQGIHQSSGTAVM